MCFPKNKKGRPIKDPVSTGKASSLQLTPTQSKVSLSKKTNSSAPVKGPTLPANADGESMGELSAREKTCFSDKSDLMQISLYKTKKKEGGSGSGPVATKPADRDQDSPEVFENNAQVVSLNPVNVTQIFVDSVIPQTNVSKQHTDIVDQNTLENMDVNMEDMIFDRLDSLEEHYPEVPQPRPQANVLQPEDETILDTMSERLSRISEKRTRISMGRTDHRHPTTPDRLPSVFTPPPPTKSDKVLLTCKRASRGQVSTRTATVSRGRPAIDYRSAGRTSLSQAADALDNTCPSHEPVDRVTQRNRPPSTERRAVTARPIEAVDNTCPSREQCEGAATAQRTPSCRQSSKMLTAHANVKDP